MKEVDQGPCRVIVSVRVVFDACHDHHEQRIRPEATSEDIGQASHFEHDLDEDVELAKIRVLLHVVVHDVPG